MDELKISGRARRFLQPVLLVMCRHLNNSKQTGFHMYILKSLKVCNFKNIKNIKSYQQNQRFEMKIFAQKKI